MTPALDHGPIVVQAVVPVLPGDDEATLAARVLALEHAIYPQAVRWFVEDGCGSTMASSRHVRRRGATDVSVPMHPNALLDLRPNCCARC